MKKGWKIKTLGEVLAVLKNGVNCIQNKDGKGFPISRIETIALANVNYDRVGYAELNETEKTKYKLERGDILFSHINSPIHVGKTALVESDNELYHGVNLLLMRCHDEVDCGYFNLFLNHIFTQGYWARTCKQSVNQASVNQGDIKKVQIPIPPLSEQEEIVEVLDKAFAAIAQAKANIEQNIANAKELFQSKLNQIFSQKGEGWVETTLGEIGKVSMCKRILKKQTTPFGDIPFYKIGTFGKTANAFIDREIYENFKEKYSFPKRGDVLISASGTIGRRVVYDGTPAYFQDSNIVWIDNSEDHILNEYLYQFYGVCDWNPSKGATISRLYNDDLRRIKISFPSISEQRTLVDAMRELSTKSQLLLTHYQTKLASLDELKKSILQKAFAGELT